MYHSKYIYQIIAVNMMSLLAISFFGCKKNSSTPTDTSTLPVSGLAYIQSTVGKYFIYKDSATLRSDSVVVTTSLLETVTGTHNIFGVIRAYVEQDYTLILTKYDTGGATEWLNGKASSSVYTTANLYLLPQGINVSGYYFRYPPCNCGNEINIPIMVVEGKTYNDVDLTYFGPENGNHPPYYAYYWAKGVGLIKRTVNDGSGNKTWTLLRNN